MDIKTIHILLKLCVSLTDGTKKKEKLNKKQKCKHIECDIETEGYLGYCQFHFSGGVLGNGETYEQYEIIEQDFIDFIKIVPINETEHLKVHSPILRDIIIRCCVQIEVFFKEWAKYICSEHNDIELFTLYHEKYRKTQEFKKARNWNFRNYFIIKDTYIKSKPLFVRPMEKNIEPFDSWITEEKIPDWWNAYNAIKHDGLNSKKMANLQNALDSLGALFTLHCANNYSKAYLKEFSSPKIINKLGKLSVSFGQITTPLDSKKYLFKDVYSNFGSGIEIETSSKFRDRARGKDKSV
ncbi:hypothetical protein GCM10009431_22380 [Gaetbulibacter jejuensis]|uniref:Uncharacterized protein n=1 Tax=Gaetbulibacter jejuensis TaxID=584607 RepID=A0ABP3V0S4_9FLAO